MSVYAKRCFVTAQDHPSYSTDCPHCQNLVDAAEDIVRQLVEAGITAREILVVLSNAQIIATNTFVTAQMPFGFYITESDEQEKTTPSQN